MERSTKVMEMLTDFDFEAAFRVYYCHRGTVIGSMVLSISLPSLTRGANRQCAQLGKNSNEQIYCTNK